LGRIDYGMPYRFEDKDITTATLTLLQVLVARLRDKGVLSQAERDSIVDTAIKMNEDASLSEDTVLEVNERAANLLRLLFNRQQ
jgi:hypothetical protein